MYAQVKGSGKQKHGYIVMSIKSSATKKSTSKIVEACGTLDEIRAAHPDMDPEEWLKQRAKELTAMEKEQRGSVSIFNRNCDKEVSSKYARNVDGGVLPLLRFFYDWLGMGKICESIKRRHRMKYDLCSIVLTLVLGRILIPASKRKTFFWSSDIVNRTQFNLEHVYRAVSVIAKENDYIQQELYHNTNGQEKRNTGVIYYDCTNYYFEIEQEDEDKIVNGKPVLGLRKFGHSKENRPNPIVQLGMFMDADGLPLSFCVHPGNTSETETIVPLEEKMANNYPLTDFTCCTDGGLGPREVRKYNKTEGRNYITVQSLKDKKCDPKVQEWALKDGQWHILVFTEDKAMKKLMSDNKVDEDRVFTIKEAKELLGDKMFKDATLFKERWFKVGKEEFEEHYIVTYSPKYAKYQKETRDRQVERAKKRIAQNKDQKSKSPNDCRRFIKEVSCTKDGEAADVKYKVLDQEKIDKEARFDGLYAFTTSLEDTAEAVIRTNSFRNEIEALFRITKTELKARPVFLYRNERIVGHFVICFIALMLLKRVQKTLPHKYTIETVLEALRGMSYRFHEGTGYQTIFDLDPPRGKDPEAYNARRDLIHSTGLNLAAMIIPTRTMDNYIKQLSCITPKVEDKKKAVVEAAEI